ncbi:MAG: TlyA family RNA methyltransferase [Anaerolineales bacterium]|jgi:23S rRNA (cytidine1920-2'-O)/16S rRNA (cytidine1409-2'-O)-methyltransferase|nr:TlyA family RNA methyltransferase [Anaerolineales bacterium]
MNKIRLDALLVARGLAADLPEARARIMAGEVRFADQVMLQPAALLPADAEITLEAGPRFVSRGGEKLEAALEAFGFSPSGLVCADVGASTGGFTDCLLQHSAARVYAIDVGRGILAWKLRQDPRVVVMEDTNARGIERLPEPASLVTIDAAFISLKVLLPVVQGWLPVAGGTVIALVKPQFEASQKQVSAGRGVIRDPAVHREVLLDTLGYAQSLELSLRGLIRSPLQGPKGNTEFLAWLVSEAMPGGSPALAQWIDQVV